MYFEPNQRIYKAENRHPRLHIWRRIHALSPPDWEVLPGPWNRTEPVPWHKSFDVAACTTARCPNVVDAQLFGDIYGFGTDSKSNLYLLGEQGMWRLVSPKLCARRPAGPPVAPFVYPRQPEFKEPEVVCPGQDGRVHVTLNVKPAVWDTGVFSIRTRSYNGRFSGPTIFVAPGSNLTIKIVNELIDKSKEPVPVPHPVYVPAPPAPHPPTKRSTESENEVESEDVGERKRGRRKRKLQDDGHGGVHGVNSTNLHLHGFHVSPLGMADNVLGKVPPLSLPIFKQSERPAVRGVNPSSNHS